MLRALVVGLALAASFDVYMLDGKYTNAAVSMARAILQNFGVIY
jgi:hypothetical protein